MGSAPVEAPGLLRWGNRPVGGIVSARLSRRMPTGR